MTYDPETYWPERYREQGDAYVAKGGSEEVCEAQVEAITPYFFCLSKRGRVLDFGCGPGRFQEALENRGFQYEGVDLIEDLGTMDVNEVRPGTFDAAVAIFVLQHITTQDRYIDAVTLLHRALVPGGELLIVDAEGGTGTDEHMEPRGPTAIWGLRPWSSWRRLGTYDGHWVAVFVK